MPRALPYGSVTRPGKPARGLVALTQQLCGLSATVASPTPAGAPRPRPCALKIYRTSTQQQRRAQRAPIGLLADEIEGIVGPPIGQEPPIPAKAHGSAHRIGALAC